MRAVAHSKDFAKKVGVPQSVGREFSKSEGGEMKESKAMMKREVAFMKRKDAPKSMIKHEEKEMKAKKMMDGGPTMATRRAPPLASAAQTPARNVLVRPVPVNAVRPAIMKKGGEAKKMAAGGLAAGHKSADGIAAKGKTRAKQVTMKKGGKC